MITKKELESVKAKIIENPDNLKMEGWHCGTAHCIGGWLETLYPKKYKISNKFIDGGQLSRNNFPDTKKIGNKEDRQCVLFTVSEWCNFLPYKYQDEFNFDILNSDFDKLEPELKAKFACLAIDSYIEKYNIN